jgi:hypothetical protein
MIKVIGTAMAVVGIAGLAAACGSSGSSAPKTVSGTEHVTGMVTGKAALANNTAFTLTWKGPVNTTGPFNTKGNGPKKGQSHTFTTKAGDLAVVVNAKPTNTQKVDPTTCRATFGTTVPYTVVGGKSTGAFKDAKGSGAVAVTFNATLPKKGGKCNESNNAQPAAGSAVGTFSGGGSLTVTK